MKDKSIDPQRLDVAAFARSQGEASGTLALGSFSRLAADLVPDAVVTQQVQWSAQAGWRRVAGGERVILSLTATTQMHLQCQRCLLPVTVPLHIARQFAFAGDEREAARLDEETEEDMLVLSRSFDLLALLEDELILSLPLVPKHENCPVPLDPLLNVTGLELEAATAGGQPRRANPFAVLQGLRRPPEKAD